MCLVLWESDPAAYPSDPDERMKIYMSHIEKVEKDLETGDVLMWGINVAGGGGFSIMKDDPKLSFAHSMIYSPYIKAEVRPMLSLDEMMEVMQGMMK